MRTLWLATLLGAALLLGGCSSLRLPFMSKDEAAAPDAAASAPAGSASAPADGVAGANAAYRIEVRAPDEQRRMLLAFLDLSRFQNAPQAEGISPLELDRLVAAAPAQARGLLETEGYFNARVTVTKVNEPGQPTPLMRIEVEPGPRTTVRSVDVGVQGELQTAAKAGDAAANATIEAIRSGWTLQPPGAFAQPAWSSAKTATLTRIRGDGYPTAAWSDTNARVDAEANQADLRVLADSGPLFLLGPLHIQGLGRYDESAVRNLADFRPGTPYTEKRLLDYQERLQAVGLFEGAVVELDVDPATAKAAPVNVRVNESPQYQATVGVGFSTNTGPRATLETTDRKLFGRPYIAKNDLELGPDRQYWQGEIDSYPLPDLYRNLLSGSLERLRTDDELRSTASLRLGRSQDRERLQRLYYVETLFSRLDSPLGASNDTSVAGNYQWIYRDVDSILSPTRGITLNLQTALGYAFSSAQANGPFSRLYGRLTWYRPVGSWFATSRLELGQVFAKSDVGVPDPLLFRAGGDNSVRGYAYRDLGPETDGVVESGRVLMTASAEMAHPLTARFPALLGAVFIDAGNAANRWGQIDPALGYGVGLRWRSPVGPLSVDLAYGQEVRQLRLHLTVGVTF